MSKITSIHTVDYGDMELPQTCAKVLYFQSAHAYLFRPIEERNIDVVEYMDRSPDFTLKYYTTFINHHIKYINMISDRISSARRIADVGCGIGMTGLLLHRAKQADICLIDSGDVDAEKATGGFHDKYLFTANLDLARTLLQNNGVPAESVSTVDIARDPFPGGPFDVILSRRSWGFHYPVSTYIEPALSSLSRDGVIILDIRDNTFDYDDLARYGAEHEILASEKKNKIVLIRPKA